MRGVVTIQILLFCVVCVNIAFGQKFNVFKSYKDAAVKPRNYGKIIQRDHPVTEYLDERQMKMMQGRNGPDTPENEFDNNWSGFKDKSVLAMLKKKNKGAKRNRTKSVSTADAEDTEDRRKLKTSSESIPVKTTSSYTFIFGVLLFAVFMLNMIFLYQSFYPNSKNFVDALNFQQPLSV
jgi:hypothetical protein